jgi:hypothetical protein
MRDWRDAKDIQRKGKLDLILLAVYEEINMSGRKLSFTKGQINSLDTHPFIIL